MRNLPRAAVFLLVPLAPLPAFFAAPAMAQEAPGAVGPQCFIQVPRLVAPQGGIAELGAAIRALDAAMKPQVDEVNRLRTRVMDLQQRQQQAGGGDDGDDDADEAGDEDGGDEEGGDEDAGGEGGDEGAGGGGFDRGGQGGGRQAAADLTRLEEELRTASAELEAGQAKLRADYAARQKELVGPVQDRIGKVAQAYATEQGCGGVKMARPADMGGLAEGNARDITDAFLAFYGSQR